MNKKTGETEPDEPMWMFRTESSGPNELNQMILAQETEN